MSAITHRGSCLCGAAAYVVDGAFERVTHCHCSMCRKAHGAAFATYATVRTEQLRFERGEDALGHYASSPTVVRSFCTRCGSPILWRDDTHEPGRIAFALGGLDTPYVEQRIGHIEVASKAPWHKILDDAPQRL
jgi:hypothetical protein